MASYTARHAAASKSNAVRNTGIAAAASAVVLGSIAPANAFAGAAPASSSYSYTNTYTTQSTGSAAALTSASRTGIVNTALSGAGTPYVWGGKAPGGWDCSGFVAWVLAQHGINVTSYTGAMMNQLPRTSAPQPGDVVFTNGYSHVGIYLGNGQMISALNPSQGTQVTSVDGGGFMPVDGYYSVGL